MVLFIHSYYFCSAARDVSGAHPELQINEDFNPKTDNLAVYVLWQEGYHGEEIRTKAFYETKERYIYLNPVRAGIVFEEKDYIYSSYASRSGLVKGLLKLSDF